MDRRPDRYAIRAAVAAIAVGFTLCTSAVGRAEPVSSAEIEAALAELRGGDDGERTLSALLVLAKARAESGHHQEAIPLLQRALAITRAQYGLFDLRQQDVLKDLGRQPDGGRARAGSTGSHDLQSAHRGEGLRRGKPEGHSGSVRPGGLVCRSRHVRPGAHGLLHGAQHRRNHGLSERADHRRAPARNRPDAHARAELSGVQAAALTGPDAGRAYRAEAEEWTRAAHSGRRGGIEKSVADRRGRSGGVAADADRNAAADGRLVPDQEAPREALPYYQRAWQVSRTAPSAPSSANTTLDVPVRVYYPTPQIVADVPAEHAEESDHYVQVEFTVAADGSVQDARIVDRDTSERYAQEIFDAVRASRFRPKFVDGQAVAVAGITYREVFWAE